MCLFNGCNSEKTIIGQVVDTSFDTDNESAQLVLHTNEGKKVGILMDTKTFVMSRIDGVDVEDFKSGKIVDTIITVKCSGAGSHVATDDGIKIKNYIAKEIWVDALLAKDTMKLTDGTSVDIWNYFNRTAYKLNDGKELLSVQTPSGPNNVYVGGIESYNDLGELAQSNVLSYYTDRGLLYDINSELERAYNDYQNTEDKSKFQSFLLAQDITLTSSNEKVMYFMTTVTHTISENYVTEMRLGAAFDRETGKHICNWELFSCSEEKVKQKILDIAEITDPVLRAEMEAAFNPDYIILFSNYLDVSFPVGTLPSQEHGYTLGLDYDDDLCEILYEWAIPKRTE